MMFKLSVFLQVLAATTPFVSSAPLVDERIIGGTEVNDYDAYPYFVEFQGSCGGTLIAPNVVLTAAHCEGVKSYLVSVGGTYINDPNAQRFSGCASWISDPTYNSNTFENDFALCKLSSNVVASSSPVTLEVNFDAGIPAVDYEMLKTIGIGIQNTGSNQQRDLQLQEVDIPYIENSRCALTWGSYIKDSMLCAGYDNGEDKGTCNGDSGGPIVKIEGNVHKHVGLTSWGQQYCYTNTPSVFARTSSAKDFIQGVVCAPGGWNENASLCADYVPPCEDSAPRECSRAFRRVTDIQAKCSEPISSTNQDPWSSICEKTCCVCGEDCTIDPAPVDPPGDDAPVESPSEPICTEPGRCVGQNLDATKCAEIVNAKKGTTWADTCPCSCS